MTDKTTDPETAPISVLLEMRADPGHEQRAGPCGRRLDADPPFVPDAMGGEAEAMGGRPRSCILRNTGATEDQLREPEADPKALRVWTGTPIAPFANPGKGSDAGPELADNPAMSAASHRRCDRVHRGPR